MPRSSGSRETWRRESSPLLPINLWTGEARVRRGFVFVILSPTRANDVVLFSVGLRIYVVSSYILYSTVYTTRTHFRISVPLVGPPYLSNLNRPGA